MAIFRCDVCPTKTRTAAMEFQDGKYGPGLRVHNPCAKGMRCTCCSNVRGDPDAKTATK